MELFNVIDILNVIKWVAVIVITGFFAQFGKMIAQFIIRKIKERKNESALLKNEQSSVINPELETEKQKLKLEKKKLKLEKKKLKVEKKK